jgi:hypothetical protein
MRTEYVQCHFHTRFRRDGRCVCETQPDRRAADPERSAIYKHYDVLLATEDLRKQGVIS